MAHSRDVSTPTLFVCALAAIAALSSTACGGSVSCDDVEALPLPDADDGMIWCDAMHCDLNTQAGCGADEKCAWVLVADDPLPLGIPACVASGPMGLHAACSTGVPGQTTGFDDCAAGLHCRDGVCLDTCSITGPTDPCAEGEVCSVHAPVDTNNTPVGEQRDVVRHADAGCKRPPAAPGAP